MTIYGYILPGAVSIARSAFLADNLTERAKQRLKVLNGHQEQNQNISLLMVMQRNLQRVLSISLSKERLNSVARMHGQKLISFYDRVLEERRGCSM